MKLQRKSVTGGRALAVNNRYSSVETRPPNCATDSPSPHDLCLMKVVQSGSKSKEHRLVELGCGKQAKLTHVLTHFHRCVYVSRLLSIINWQTQRT